MTKLCLSGYIPEDFKSTHYRDVHFVAALFSTVNQPTCPTVEEWIKKTWYRDTMEDFQS